MDEKYKKTILKIDYGIEEFILIIIILLNIFDYLQLLPGEIDYVKKIISWSVLGFLVYKFGLSEIFFGTENRRIDLTLLFAYFSLIVNKFVNYSIMVVSESVKDPELHSMLLLPFHIFIVKNSALIEISFFLIGIITLIILSIYVAFFEEFRRPSVADVFGNEDHIPKRFITSLIIFIVFFVIFFNLFMEWFAIAVDAPIVVAGILFYIFFSKRFPIESYVYKIGDIGESFYNRFVQLFHYKHTIMLGVAGMLVLHALTDIGIFLMPYITGFSNELYFSGLETGHLALFELYATEIIITPLESILVWGAYILNTIAIFYLLLTPAVIWYCYYKNKKMPLSRGFISMFYASVLTYLLLPVYKVKSFISHQGGDLVIKMIGADISTSPVSSSIFFDNIGIIIGLSLLLGCVIYIIAGSEKPKLMLGYSWIIISFLFFGYYIYNYASSVILYYIMEIASIGWSVFTILITPVLLSFLIVSAFFYIAGYSYLFYKLFR